VVSTYNNIAITWSQQVIQVTTEVKQWEEEEEEDIVAKQMSGDKHPF
jgi:gas vesicle protein